jgi:copper(I)-binding protein
MAAPAGLHVSGAWIRALPGAQPAAAYFTLSNDGARPQVLIGAASPACASLMIHQSREVRGVDTMRMLPSLVVPAHGVLRFAPGGYHLMCMSPAKGLRGQGSTPVTLRFRNGALTTRFAVGGVRG